MMADVAVSREVAAPADVAWALLADLSRMPEWSPENERVEWLGCATEAALGARFRGTNRNGAKTWKSVAKMTVFEPGRALAFHVKAGPFNVADWRYTIEPNGNGCRVTESWTDRRNGAVKVLSRLVTGVEDRPSHNRDSMDETLRRLAAAAETLVTD
jgi:hypothetical protein